MLEFMTDQQDNIPEGQPTQPNANAQQAEGQTGNAVALQRARRAKQSSVALIVTFCAVALALLFMINRAQPQAAKAAPIKADQSQIEAAIKRLTGLSDELATHMDQLLQRFHELSAVAQVALEDLVKNPFELELLAGISPQVELTQQEQPEPNAAQTERAAQLQAQEQARIQAEEERKQLAELAARQKAEEARRQQVRQAATGLRLQGIVHAADEGVCIIDGQVLSIGQQIKGFELISIKANSVQLRWPDPEMTFTLKIAE